MAQKRIAMILTFAALGMAASVPAAADRLYVEFGGKREEISNIKIDEIHLCALKKMVAQKLGLDISKFDLLKSGTTLKPEKTMKDQYVRDHNTLEVREVSTSWQCR